MKTTSSKFIPQSVLMVCLGNICRSPIAEEVLRQKTIQAGLNISLDSCGTSGWHIGEKADSRSRTSAKKHGYDIDNQRARQINLNDFEKFDLMLAMDSDNLNHLKQLKQQLINAGKAPSSLSTIDLYSSQQSQYQGQKVPDPYYGDLADFEHTLSLIEIMADAWIEFWLYKKNKLQ